MKRIIITTMTSLAIAALSAQTQLQTTVTTPQQASSALTGITRDEQMVEHIRRINPNAIKDKGLSPEQADLAARTLKAPRKASYNIPDGGQEFWFVMPEGYKLGYARGFYRTVGTSGDLELMAEDETNNLSARFNGALVDGLFHTISGDLSWAEYGLVMCRDHVYTTTGKWKLYKSVDLAEYSYLISQEVAVDPRTHRVYGTFLRDDYETYDIACVDYNTAEINRIGTARRDYVGLGMNAEGRLFGVDMDGILYEISLKNGSETRIGATGIKVRDEDDRYYIQSAECGEKGNVLYWAATFPDGKSALYAIDLATAKATKVADYPKYTLVHCLTVPSTTAHDDAPDAVSNLQASFPGTSTTGTLSFTLPKETYSGEYMSGNIDYIVLVDAKEQATGQGAVGSAVSIEMTLSEGSHYVEVYAENSSGRGAQAHANVYIGQDTPGQVQNLQLSVKGLEATISWEPAIGANGGYPGEVTYAVRRNSDNKILAQGLTDLTYTDQIPETDYRQLSYSVVASSASANGIAATTKSVAAGRPYELPYEENFLTRDAFTNNYTVVDANGDGVSWVSNVGDNDSYAVYTYNIDAVWTNVQANDWLFTPGFNLKGGKKYRLTFSEACYGSDTQCVNKIEVKAGQGAEVEAMTLQLLPVTTYKNNQSFKDVTVEFTPTADGVYNIGFHAVSDPRKTDFMIDQIRVEESTTSDSPAAVTDLAVTPGDKGARQATVSFTAPTKTLGDNTLSAISKIRVIRDNKTLQTFDTPAPGEQLSYTDKKATTGFNTYTVVATNDVSDSPVAQATGYIGIDIPSFDYTSVGVEDNLDRITVKWDQVGTTGLNGGYVNPAQVGYAIYSVNYEAEDGGMSIGDYISMPIGTDHFDIHTPTDQGEQRVVSYAIAAVNEVGADENHTGATYGMVVGQPYPLPFIQSAANSKTGNKLMWAETENNPDATFKFSTDSYDQDNGSFAWTPSSRTYTLNLNTGKVTLAGSTNPKLMFAHKCTPKTRYQMDVVVQTPDREETTLKSINYQNITGSEAKWTLETIDLTDFANEDYIVVKFKMSSNATTNSAISGKTLLLDAINIIDMQTYNLSIDIDAPASITAGRATDLNVVVHNVGERDASGYRVTLLLDGEELLTETVNDKLSSLESKTITMNYKPSVFGGASRSTLRAELTWMYDLVDEDNEMEAELSITDPTVAMPRNATTLPATAGTTLGWDAPEQVIEEVTESFEGPEYTDFDLCGITSMGVREGKMGEWTVWNLDDDGTWNGPSGPTGHLPNFDDSELEGIDFPNRGEVCAWMVFNNARVIGNMPIEPLSGNKMAATFDDFVQQDTWLITPELSGNEQTVTFYIAAPVSFDSYSGEVDQTETFEVLVSKGGLTEADFESLGIETLEDQEWAEMEIDLEAGTKYLAVRNVSGSYNAMALFVDDFTYERISPLPTSYNVYGDEQLLTNVAAGQKATVDGRAGQYAVTAVYANGDESLPLFFQKATGIESYSIEHSSLNIDHSAIYDLSGRNINGPCQKGIYIHHDGNQARKVVVK